MTRHKGMPKSWSEPTFDRLLSRTIVSPNGCIVWPTCDRSGYGQINIDGKMHRVHRVCYEMFVGPIPDSLELDHLCRNRACVAPSHLEPVTHRVNSLRGVSFALDNLLKTHCPQGHPYSTENTYLRPGKHCRDCRQCNREAVRRYQARKRDAAP